MKKELNKYETVISDLKYVEDVVHGAVLEGTIQIRHIHTASKSKKAKKENTYKEDKHDK